MVERYPEGTGGKRKGEKMETKLAQVVRVIVFEGPLVECQKHHHEEWQTGNSGDMSHMRHQDVQNREELRLIF